MIRFTTRSRTIGWGHATRTLQPGSDPLRVGGPDIVGTVGQCLRCRSVTLDGISSGANVAEALFARDDEDDPGIYRRVLSAVAANDETFDGGDVSAILDRLSADRELWLVTT